MKNCLKGVHINPMKVLGRSIKVVLKGMANDRAAFQFKVTGCGENWIDGFDEERLNLRIYLDDIDFIVEVF